jgi:hypothetical protein
MGTSEGHQKSIFNTSKVKMKQPQAQPKTIKKLSKHQINQSERNFSQKGCLYLKSVKEPKIRMGATRRNLQARPRILKKIRDIKSTNQNENFFKKKVCLVP